VTALAFGPVGNLLAVGHANGDVAFWELKRAGWECVKALKGARSRPSLDLALAWSGPAPPRAGAAYAPLRRRHCLAQHTPRAGRMPCTALRAARCAVRRCMARQRDVQPRRLIGERCACGPR